MEGTVGLGGRGLSLTVDGWPSKQDFATADVIVWYSANAGFRAERVADLDAFLARGGGMVYLHWAINGQGAPQELADRLGLSSVPGKSKYRHGPIELVFSGNSESPITKGFKTLKLVDESYWDLATGGKDVRILATCTEEGAPRPMMWTRTVGKGRVFGSIAGHYTWTFDDPLYRILVLRGLAWSAGEPVDRLLDLVKIGARVDHGQAGETKP